MPLKNSNTVAVERRTDLASLFCMIGRHGPAVVLAAVALVSVLAAFIIYRTVRGKRRKATAAAADGDGGRGAEHEPNPEPNPEDAFSRADSTDVSDEGPSDVKEEASLIQSHPKVRLRRAAANEKNSPPCSSAHQVFEEDKTAVEITDKEVPDREDRPEVEPALDSPVPFDQTSCVSENIDETLQDSEAESSRAEPALENRVTHRSKGEKQRLHLHNRGDERKLDEDEAMAAVHCADDQVKGSVKECESIQRNDSSPLGISSDSQAKASGTVKVKERQVEDETPPSSAKDAWLNSPRPDLTSPEEQTQPGPVAALAEEPRHQENGSMTNKEHFAATAPVTCGCNGGVTVCPDQHSGSVGTDGAFETRLDSAADACGGAPVKSEGASHPHVGSCPDVSEVSSPADPALAGVVNPSICKIHPLSFEQSELTENDRDGASSPAVGPESGISSMAVSPDSQDAGRELESAANAAAFPALAHRAAPEEGTEAHNGLFAGGAASFVTDDRYQSVNGQKPLSKSTDWAAANEDVFGHEVDARYQSALDEYMAQITAGVSSDPIQKTDVKAVGCGESVKKKEMQVKENEEECDKTEISIMEATMDNNEWITDSNYHVLPWMNACTPPFAPGDQKPSVVPSEAAKRSCPLTEAEDAAVSADVQPQQALCAGEESSESSKKVVAVQPMPQSVGVTFRIHYMAHSPYQTVAVTGSRQELGNWKEFIPLERAKDGHWAAVVSLPAESHVEWKFVLLDKGEVCRWEECGNRLLDTGCGDDVVVHRWWGLL